MRNINFKAKNTHTEQWIYGSLISKRNKYIGNYEYKDNIFIWVEHEVDPDTICQFTNLYDDTKWEELSDNLKVILTEESWKGIPIYDNDILNVQPRRDNNNSIDFIVKWSDYSSAWTKESIGTHPLEVPLRSSPFYKSMKVISNIHD